MNIFKQSKKMLGLLCALMIMVSTGTSYVAHAQTSAQDLASENQEENETTVGENEDVTAATEEQAVEEGNVEVDTLETKGESKDNKNETKEYTVTFFITDKIAPVKVNVKAGELVPAQAAPKITHLEFMGWYLNGATKPWNFAKDKMPAKNIELFALYNPSKLVEITGKDIQMTTSELLALQNEKKLEQELIKRAEVKVTSKVEDVTIDMSNAEVAVANLADLMKVRNTGKHAVKISIIVDTNNKDIGIVTFFAPVTLTVTAADTPASTPEEEKTIPVVPTGNSTDKKEDKKKKDETLVSTGAPVLELIAAGVAMVAVSGLVLQRARKARR